MSTYSQILSSNTTTRPLTDSSEITSVRSGPAPSVLHVLDHSWPVLSGYAIRSRNLISAQRRAGHSIRVLTGPLHELDDASSTDLVMDDVPYMRTPIEGRFAHTALQKRWPLLREHHVVRALRTRIVEIVSRHPVDVIHSHSPALCGLAALQAARMRRIPLVYEIRAFWEDAASSNAKPASLLRNHLTYQLETYVARNANAVAAIAKPMLQDLEARGIAADRLFHAPNGVDAGRFVPQQRDEQLARELQLADRPVLGFLGSLYRYEGLSWLVEAAAQLRSRGCNFGILIVGRGEDQPAIAKAISETNAGAFVRCIENVPHDQIARYYSIIDIAVYPRRSLRLTELVTPLKPLEAMAFGKAVLASSVGGIRELVESERTGLLFKPESVSEFCAQAERLLSSKTLRCALAQQGRDFVVKERDWSRLAQRYRRMYDFAQQARH